MDTTQSTPPALPEFVQSYRMGFAVTAVEMAERIGLVEYLDQAMRWDRKQCRVSPGTRLLALMITFLVDPRAVYRIPEFYTELDCAVLFGADRQAADFNDDAIGRALEKLFETTHAGQVHTGLCQQAVERLGLDPTLQLQCDTTSITLTGEYPDPGAGSQPTYGYNKDGHPDCKQLVVGVVARTDGIPYGVDVCDGNMDDPTWSRQAIMSTGSALAEDLRDTMLFVADSKLVSQDTVEDLCEAGIRFVSRLPNTFGIEQTTKAQARQRNQWETIGVLGREKNAAVYRLSELPGTIRDKPVRLIVIHSSALEAKAAHWEEKTLQTGALRIDASLHAITARTFACQADAESAWQRWQANKWLRQTGWVVIGHVVPTETTPGTPASNTPTWRIEASRTETNPAFLDSERFRRSTFILVANDPRRSARELLTAYKTQQVVEQDNALVKGPLGIAPLFLKDTKKIDAYVYVVYLALLLWQCMQAVMRQNQVKLGITLPYPHGALQPAPTTKRLKEIVGPIQVAVFRNRDGTLRRRRSELTLVQRQALLLVGMDSRRFTQIPSG